MHAAGDVGQVEVTSLVGQPGMEDDLEQEVTQFLLDVPVAARRPAPSSDARASRTS